MARAVLDALHVVVTRWLACSGCDRRRAVRARHLTEVARATGRITSRSKGHGIPPRSPSPSRSRAATGWRPPSPAAAVRRGSGSSCAAASCSLRVTHGGRLPRAARYARRRATPHRRPRAAPRPGRRHVPTLMSPVISADGISCIDHPPPTTRPRPAAPDQPLRPARQGPTHGSAGFGTALPARGTRAGTLITRE